MIDRDRTMLDACRSAVERAPGSALLCCGADAITVRQADALSDALAVGLAELGVGGGDRVALLMQNVPQHPLALLAIWKLGAIAVACSPMLRAGELASQLRDAEPRVLIAETALLEEVVRPARREAPVPTVLATDGRWDVGRQGPTELPPPAADGSIEALAHEHRGGRPPHAEIAADDVAVLTYTSGTTGPPKGAMNTHRNILHSAEVLRDWAELTPDDVALGIAPLFHVTGLVAHMAVAMIVPMPLVLAGRFHAGTTAALVERHRATFAVASITAYRALLHDPDAARRDLRSLRKAYSGGAPVSVADAEAWERRTGSMLHPIYGLTETTSPSHMTPLGRRPPVDAASGALAVGRTVPGASTRVLDPAGRALGPGQRGEVAIRGPQVVPGYWRRPDETARTFPGGELRTGDVGLVDDQGWLYVIDRLKDLINASGYKVWPREVEEVLGTHPAVREVAVVGVPDPYRGETVKAVVALHGDTAVDAEELIAYGRERLAAYKYPRIVEVVPELPKNASGKVLRRALRGP